MPTASTAALKKRREEKKAAAEKLNDEATAKGEAAKEQMHRVTLVRDSRSRKPGGGDMPGREFVARGSPSPVEVTGEPASDVMRIELNTINVVGERILTARRRGDTDETVAMERARKRLAGESEDVAAAARGLNVDADEKLYADLEKLDVSATQVVSEVPSGTSKLMYRDRDPVPCLEDFQPAATWTEEPMTLPSMRPNSMLKQVVADEYGKDGAENYPFDTYEVNREKHWNDLKRLGYL